MANSHTIRSFLAKMPFVRYITTTSASKWSREHLNHFNINIGTPQSFNDFFGRPMPETYNEGVLQFIRQIEIHVSGEPINYFGPQSQNVKNALSDLHSAASSRREAKYCVDDLSVSMFRLFGYEQDNLKICMNPSYTLHTNSNTKKAVPNTILKLNDQRLFLIQENKSYNVGLNRKLPEPQMIAQVIAALQYNYTQNVPLQQQFFPVIIMLGFQSIFYLIPILQELLQAVKTGSRSAIITEVKNYTLLTSNQIAPAAMLEPNVCREIAACYTVFREFTRPN